MRWSLRFDYHGDDGPPSAWRRVVRLLVVLVIVAGVVAVILIRATT